MNPEQLTSTPTKRDLLNAYVQKLTMKTHLDVQQREDIRRDLDERMKFVPPDHRVGEQVFLLSKKIRAKFSKDGNVENGLKVEIIAFKGPMVVISTGATIFPGKCKHATKTFGHCGSGRTA